ncbi:MAG: peptidoglycan DD-metalloendopeptidase family protein [Candidatus Binatia bacterium]
MGVVRQAAVIAILGALVLASACRTAGFRHKVQPGENLYRIGKAYGVDYQELARVNGIDDPRRIEVGQRLVVPGATRDLPVEMITPTRAREDQPPASELPPDRLPFLWPVEGAITSTFGPRGETHHDGVDISAAAGTPVRAARGGRVLYSDELRGYGNLVIVDHGDGYATVYAHNRANTVTSGTVVRQGDVIGEVGETGETSQPNLHFEVRKDNVARNPLFYLPPRKTASREAPTP